MYPITIRIRFMADGHIRLTRHITGQAIGQGIGRGTGRAITGQVMAWDSGSPGALVSASPLPSGIVLSIGTTATSTSMSIVTTLRMSTETESTMSIGTPWETG